MNEIQAERQFRRGRRISIVVALLLLLAWEVAARGGFISPLFFPAPSIIVVTLWEMLTSGQLLVDTAVTIARMTAGLLLGGSFGLLLGLLMGWSRAIRTVAEPFVAVAHPLPKIALLPLILIIFGLGDLSKIVLISLAAFFPMLINTLAGVRQIEPIHWQVAANYGAGSKALMRRVVLPGSLPLILTGLRLALNSAIVVTLAVELLVANNGLGDKIWLAWETLRIGQLYAVLAVIGLLGVTTNWLLLRLRQSLIPWQVDNKN